MRRRQNIQNIAIALAGAVFLSLGIAHALAHPSASVSVQPETLPAATVGKSYSQTLTATNANGQISFGVTAGSLPSGLTLSSAGVLSGKPATAGSSSFTVSAVGANGKPQATRDYTLAVQSAPTSTTTSSTTTATTTATIGPSSLPSGTVGTAYSQTISVSGPTPPYTVRVTQGSLPSGLSLSSGGSLSGTPSVSGSFAFTVSAFTSGGTYVAFRDYTMSVGAKIATTTTTTTTISPSSLPSGTVGTAYSQTISVSGPKPPYTVRVTQGSLPSGLSLSSGGSLSGTPSVSGSFAFTVSAFTSGGTYVTFRDYTMSVGAKIATTTSTTVSPSSLPSGTVGTAYSQTISVSGPTPPYTVRVTQGSLPSGLSLSSTGSLSGKPSVSGSFRFTVSAYTSAGTYAAFRDYTLSIGSGTSTTSPSGSLYFGDDFENGITSPWSVSGASNQFALVSGWTGKAVQLTDYGSSSSGGGSAGSQMSALWFNGNYALAHASQGQNTWYHLKLYFPSTYQPTTGDWNWAVEWHIDGTTQSSCSSAVSVALGVYTDYPVVTNAYGKNPRLALRLAGGSCSSPTLRSIQLPSNSLQRGHWYDLMFHFVWSTSSTTGLAEWWVDGSQQVSTHFPTLYSRNGSSSTNNFGFYNYRLAANWAASIAYDHVRIGSSQSAVQ